MQERKNPSSAQDFFAYSIKEKRVKRFSTPDFINQIRAVRRIFRVFYKRKTARSFFASRLTERSRPPYRSASGLIFARYTLAIKKHERESDMTSAIGKASHTSSILRASDKR